MASAARPAPRERLLSAADELFSRQGIAATGVDAVLRSAQVAPATLYAHFTGKDALVAAYLQRRHERWRAVWDAALLRAGGDATARVLSLFDALEGFRGVAASQQPARGCAFLAAAVEVTDQGHPAHPWLQTDTRLLAERLGKLCTETGASQAGDLAAELLLIYDGALAARARRGVVADVGWPELDFSRSLAAAAVARHLVS